MSDFNHYIVEFEPMTQQHMAALDDLFRGELMRPSIVRGEFAEIRLCAGETYLVPADMADWNQGDVIALHVGYFARLSASGYTDCTDWSGPFGSAIEAIDYLIDTYADGMGEDEEEVECARCCMIWPVDDTGIDSDGDPICIDCANRHDIAL